MCFFLSHKKGKAAAKTEVGEPERELGDQNQKRKNPDTFWAQPSGVNDPPGHFYREKRKTDGDCSKGIYTKGHSDIIKNSLWLIFRFSSFICFYYSEGFLLEQFF
ncbi:MAG: hypothetical protein OS130_11920 [Thermodesulfobacteriota bacterium]|nr:MAG: hypothetical protein OS130_11920 [Thermodesulfobacteriota bacterium]